MQQREQSLLDQGQPPAYAKGQADGCSTGAGGFFPFKKDVVRYQTDPLYAQGWEDGLADCREKAQRMDRMMGY